MDEREGRDERERKTTRSIRSQFVFLSSEKQKAKTKRTWCSRPCGDQVMTSVSYEFRNMALVFGRRRRERACLKREGADLSLFLFFFFFFFFFCRPPRERE